VPGTIGAITWLARNENRVARIKAGLVLTCVGDRGAFTYKKSRRGDACIDLAMAQVFRESGVPHRVIDFFPYGYDERQYCSPGFNLPVGCFMRSQHGTFPEYHTSADDLRFISPEALAESLETVLKAIDAFERRNNGPRTEHGIARNSHGAAADGPRFLNLRPKGEPHLAKYDMGTMLGADIMPALWVLNLSDGLHSLADIAAKSSLPFDNLAHAADILCTHGLLKEVEP
jgi:aminopeptidase-like protein